MVNSEIEEHGRYWKFAWFDLDHLPLIGKMDYQPKSPRLTRLFGTGIFHGEFLEAFPAAKANRQLAPFGSCIYCGREKDDSGRPLKLSSEHIIPEYLGAGLELPAASCADCQKITSDFEGSLAADMFDPIRKSFALKGKNGVLKKTHFPLDIGYETTRHEFIHEIDHPTILVLPALYPASSYSRRSKDASDIFNFRIYNINAHADRLQPYEIESFSSQSVDLVRFSQVIAKIAHVYAMQYFGLGSYIPTVTDFIRTSYPPGVPAEGYFEHVGSMLAVAESITSNLHEIEVGKITWSEKQYFAARVRLFASCGMPSYYVTVGKQP